jgi:hypothetical protein
MVEAAYPQRVDEAVLGSKGRSRIACSSDGENAFASFSVSLILDFLQVD